MDNKVINATCSKVVEQINNAVKNQIGDDMYFAIFQKNASKNHIEACNIINQNIANEIYILQKASSIVAKYRKMGLNLVVEDEIIAPAKWS